MINDIIFGKDEIDKFNELFPYIGVASYDHEIALLIKSIFDDAGITEDSK